MGEIRMAAWGALTPQQKYDYFNQGYKYRTDYNVLTYSCNTCYPNVPDGFNATRPAGSSTYTYNGYGISTGSLADAWEKYVVANGGKTVAMTQAEQEAIAAKLAAEDAARVAAEAAAKAAADAEQLRLKQEMTTSPTASWASGFQEEAAAKLAAETSVAEAAAKAVASSVAAQEAASVAEEEKAKADVVCGQGTWGVCKNVPAPTPAPVVKCPEGTTRTVKCPKDPNKMVTQRCINGEWKTLPADEKVCAAPDPAKLILAALIIAIILVFFMRK